MDSSDTVLCISRLGRGRTSDSGRCGTIASLDASTPRLSLASEPQTRSIVPPALPTVPEKRCVSQAPAAVRKHTSKRPTGPKPKSKSKAKAKDGIPRPPNCFILFRSANKGTFSRQKDISREAAKKWNGMSEDEQEPYRKMADDARTEHKEKYPEYKYKPAERGRKAKAKKAKKAKKVSVLYEGLEFDYPVSTSASTSTSGSGYPSPSSSASVIPSSPELMTPPLFSSPLINPDEMVVDVDDAFSAFNIGQVSALDDIAKYVGSTSVPAYESVPEAGVQFDHTAFELLDLYKGGMDSLPPLEYPMSNDFDVDMGRFYNTDCAGMTIPADMPMQGFGYDFQTGPGFGML